MGGLVVIAAGVFVLGLVLALPVYLDRQAMRRHGKRLFNVGNLGALWLIAGLGYAGVQFMLRGMLGPTVVNGRTELLNFGPSFIGTLGGVLLSLAAVAFAVLLLWNVRRVGSSLAMGGAVVEAFVVIPAFALAPGFVLLLLFCLFVAVMHLPRVLAFRVG